MRLLHTALAGLIWIAPAPILADETESLGIEEQIALAQRLESAFVRVEYTLKYDQGDEPTAAGWRERCPHCGSYHNFYDGAKHVREKRPYETGGLLLTPTQVLTLDPQLHPRFVERIAVRRGDRLVEATVAAYPHRENGLLLALVEPLTESAPLEFAADRPEPWYAVTYQLAEADWLTCVQPVPKNVMIRQTGPAVRPVPPACLIIDGTGAAVGASMNGELPVDGSWKGSPLDWPCWSAEEMQTVLATVEDSFSHGLLHTTLTFRSPKMDEGSPSFRYRRSQDDQATTIHTLSIVSDEATLIVLADMNPKQTARLERIEVRLPNKTACRARFGHTLREYGCFTAELDETGRGAVRSVSIDSGDIRSIRNQALVWATVSLFGEDHLVRYLHARVPSFQVGYRRNVYPSVPQDESNLFLFRSDGTLVAAPLTVRETVKDEDSWRSNEAGLTPLAFVIPLLDDLAANADASNVPVSETEENRIAWLGVVLQNLDTELARMNAVSELTQDGSFGALVSFVYPDSPAAEAGLQPGDILLRIRAPDHHRPIPVHTDDGGFGYDFPWSRLSEVPEEYLDQIPRPWPSADNAFARTLTDLGFGRPFELEYFREGRTQWHAFTVVESPPHYDSAPRYKSEPLGLTVRDLTYELRRYYQRRPDEPGVVVSKIEPGSRAAVAGLRPYEIITHVNDQPVADVGAFRELANDVDQELRLNVRQMTKGRIVKIRADRAAATQPAMDEP